ncbi:MAG: hypothetical protein B6245_06620 [Desulfobacteraceae bacterium 4572_88]|nr:MAG: hypothetical protein B6245_06620 [Desulfobacteraceae bacterium 4572_88]
MMHGYHILLLCVLLAFFPQPSDAEFYKYVDKNGTVHFVDDPSKIPEEYLDQLKVIPEKYDDLPEAERAMMRIRMWPRDRMPKVLTVARHRLSVAALLRQDNSC